MVVEGVFVGVLGSGLGWGGRWVRCVDVVCTCVGNGGSVRGNVYSMVRQVGGVASWGRGPLLCAFGATDAGLQVARGRGGWLVLLMRQI